MTLMHTLVALNLVAGGKFRFSKSGKLNGKRDNHFANGLSRYAEAITCHADTKKQLADTQTCGADSSTFIAKNRNLILRFIIKNYFAKYYYWQIH
jgi:hypothetical protein